MNNLTADTIKFLISRLIENANDTVKARREDTSDVFIQGKCLAYYEMLDILKNELDVRDVDLKGLGLDFDVDKLV